MGIERVICVLLVFTNCVFCSSNVPVLIWNSHQPSNVDVPAVSALQQLSVASVQARYFDAFRPDNVLLFEQDALSVEDLSSHSADMQHISSFMETSHSLYLPNVIQPMQLQHDLVQQGYKVTSLSAGTAISELKLDPTEKNLVVVKLPPTITNPSRSRALRKAGEHAEWSEQAARVAREPPTPTHLWRGSLPRLASGELGIHVRSTGPAFRILPPGFDGATSPLDRSRPQSDEVIQSVISKIGEVAKFTVVYTARKPSVESGEAGSGAERTRVARSLQQFGGPALPANFHNNTGILIYFRKNMQVSLNGNDGPFYDIPETTFNNESQSDNSDDKQSIQLSYTNVTVGETLYSKFKITFNFLRQKSYWRSPTAKLDLTKKARDTPTQYDLQLMKWIDETVPIGKSYACSVPLNYRQVPVSTTGIVLRINGVQVQAFMDADKQYKFGPSWDCVGFFTIGIWSGLWASLIAVIILSIGMMMLSSIKTMDRFDDPKGKTIMVPLILD